MSIFVNKAAMRPSVWISFLFTLFAKTSTLEGSIHSITACYIPATCSFFNLNCSNGPSGSIRIMKAEYRHKYNSGCNDGSCNKTDSCCYFNESDCKENFSELHALSLYQQCSGRKICERNQATISSNKKCNITSQKEQYVYLEYKCISETEIVDICDSPKINVYSEVNIMLLNKTRQKELSSCTCLVESSSTVHYKLVDIRLFTPTNNDDKYECAKDTLTIGKQSIQCETNKNNSFVYMGSSNYEGDLPVSESDNTIQLLYAGSKETAMVWISLYASKGNFTVQCFSGTLTTTPIVTESSGKIKTTFSKYSTNMEPNITRVETVKTEKTTSTFWTSTTSQSMPIAASSSARTNSGFTTVLSMNATEAEILLGEKKKSESTSSDLVPVAAIVVIIPVAIAILIVYRRKFKKPEDKGISKHDASNGQTNCITNNLRNSDSIEGIKKSNYEDINDDHIVTYSKPLKKNKSSGGVSTDGNNGTTDLSSEEYDRIEFEKGLNKSPNYDVLPAFDGKVHDNIYSHVSSQSKYVPSAFATEYSHCKAGKNVLPNNNMGVAWDKGFVTSDYSHMDISAEWMKDGFSDTEEKDRYNSISFDKTTNIMSKAEKDYPTFADIKSPDCESEICIMDVAGIELSVQCPSGQDIKALSQIDNSLELQQRDAYDTPISKKQQYPSVLKTKKEQRPKEIDTGSTSNLGLDGSSITARITTNISDYEFAKPINV